MVTPPTPPELAPAGDAATRLLDLVRQLAEQLQPHRAGRLRVTLDSSLDRDLQIDSLSRVELLARLEEEFGVALPEQVLASAETPRDLLRALQSAPGARAARVDTEVRTAALDAVDAPVAACTLVEVLDWHCAVHAERTHIYLYGEGDEPEEITYGDLVGKAERVAAGLQARDLAPGQTVALMLPTSAEYLYSFCGVVLAGGVPVPIYPPARPSQIEDHMRRHAGILDNAMVSLLITTEAARTAARVLKGQVSGLREVVTAAELLAAPGEPGRPVVGSEQPAFLQYTSGSTGNPKGVVLTHANLLANLRAMGDVIRLDSTDVFVSWLPLYHDMGLIGAWLGSLYYAYPLVEMAPFSFLARPQRWLQAIHKHRGTLSAAPNFGYELCIGKVPDAALEGLDLSSWRLALNGAEPVSPQTVRRFIARFGPCGFRESTMFPAYGLAESSVGLAFPPIDRAPIIDRVQREPLAASGQAVPAVADDVEALEYVACGQPLPGHEIRIVDDAGREVPERHEGRIQFRGPSATGGYFRNREATAQLFDGEWLETGDLAYVAGGELYPTSRIKDVIIRAGRNIHPYEVEEAVGDLSRIRKGCVAVFGSPDPKTGTERIIVLAETRETAAEVLEELRTAVVQAATDLLGTPPDDVVMAPPHSVLKTSSGKIRRAVSRQLYEQGRIGKRRAVGWQFARLLLGSVVPRLRRAGRRLGEWLFSGYAWLVFLVLPVPVWILVVGLPWRSWRFGVVRAAVRLFLWATRIPLAVHGAAHLPRDRSCVVVANHASYLDAPMLVAALEVQPRFVGKQELARNPLARVFFERLGAEFVERFDQQAGVADARRIAESAAQGQPLVFFAEGTFTRRPGLLPFRMGAFVTAAEHGLPVVPVTIRGTRSIMRAGSWFLRRGAIQVTVAAPVQTGNSAADWAGAVGLRDAARAVILRHTGEPDLAHEVVEPGAG